MSQTELNGMTVNERLAILRLLGDFDRSIQAKNIELAIEILIKARLTNEQALETVNLIFENPEKYGYR